MTYSFSGAKDMVRIARIYIAHTPFRDLVKDFISFKVESDQLKKRIAELERHNELLLNTISDDNKHLAEKDRVIALLRAVAEATRNIDRYRAYQAAVDGGALDGDK